MADRCGTGLVALPGAVDDLASLVHRSAAATRLEPGDGRVPGAGHAVREPGAEDADELAGRGHQCVAVAAVAPGQAPRGARPGAPRARSGRRAVHQCHPDRPGLPRPSPKRRPGTWPMCDRSSSTSCRRSSCDASAWPQTASCRASTPPKSTNPGNARPGQAPAGASSKEPNRMQDQSGRHGQAADAARASCPPQPGTRIAGRRGALGSAAPLAMAAAASARRAAARAGGRAAGAVL